MPSVFSWLKPETMSLRTRMRTPSTSPIWAMGTFLNSRYTVDSEFSMKE